MFYLFDFGLELFGLVPLLRAVLGLPPGYERLTGFSSL
jgi:hypothetical protein